MNAYAGARNNDGDVFCGTCVRVSSSRACRGCFCEKQRSEVDIEDDTCGLLHILLVIISIIWQTCVAYVGQTDEIGWTAISTPLPALSTCVELASGGAHKPSGASLHGSLGLSCIGEVEVVRCLV